MSHLGIGFDLGTEKTGIFIVKDGNLEHGRPVLLTLSRQKANVFTMADQIKAFLDEHVLSYGPSWACFEDVYLDKNAATFKTLTSLGAIVESDIRRNSEARIYRATTTQIDKSCNIPMHLKRPQRKQATMKFAEMLFGPTAQDVADALCVAYHGYYAYRQDMIAEGDLT